jgi:hypothetical protein
MGNGFRTFSYVSWLGFDHHGQKKGPKEAEKWVPFSARNPHWELQPGFPARTMFTKTLEIR